MKIPLLLLLFLLAGCCYIPSHPQYCAQYAYLQQETYCQARRLPMMKETPYFLIVLVNARHLDYSDVNAFFRTLVKHPSDGSKNRDFGHAWIYLQGNYQGQKIVRELGHSGERGLTEARYFDGVMNCIDFGYSNPTDEQIKNSACHPHEPNPISYLWHIRDDGFCQKGSGGHRPTYAVKIDLQEEDFWRIMQFIDPKNYDYRPYAITHRQCSTFAVDVAALGGLHLESAITIPIKQNCEMNGRMLRLWEDPAYASITLSNPDILEKSMVQSVIEGRAENALTWYCSPH